MASETDATSTRLNSAISSASDAGLAVEDVPWARVIMIPPVTASESAESISTAVILPVFMSLPEGCILHLVKFRQSFGATNKGIVELGESSCHSDLQLEDSLHQHPFFARLGFRKGLLKLPHQILPLLHLRAKAVGFGLRCKRKLFADLHDHEHTSAQQIDLHVFDAGIFDALDNLGPDLLMMALVLGNKLGVILEIESQTEATLHFTSPAGTASSLPTATEVDGRYPRTAK